MPVVTVDFEGVESGGGRIHVPEGDYGLKIVKVKLKKAETSGKNCFFIDFKLIKGNKKGVGKVLAGHSASLQKQALWNLRNLLEACGKQVPSKAVKIDSERLVGLTCAGTLVDDEYEGKKKSVISVFFPLDDLGKVSDDGDDLGDAVEGEEEEAEETPKKTAGKKTAGKKKPAEEVEEETEESGEEEEEELFS